ncbi:MAG: hypothetical protein KGO02_10155 [Alphaproteobacteria bacterium]|nr:hypothetical protein [Alphaproteobacteria bacterium]
MSRLFRQIRLLPLVIGLCGILIAVKGASLVAQARAAVPAAAPSGAPAAPGRRNQAQAGEAESASEAMLEDNTDSASEIDVLTSLAKRRRALDAEAHELDMRANLLKAAEKRIDGKIADLKTLKGQIQGLLGQRDAAKAKQLAALISVYSAMKPRNAGRIFDSLDAHVLLEVAAGMQPDALAPILSAMSPDKAQALTVALAERLRLPKVAAFVPNAPGSQANAAPAPGPQPNANPTVPARTAAPLSAAAASSPALAQAQPGSGGKSLSAPTPTGAPPAPQPVAASASASSPAAPQN